MFFPALDGLRAVAFILVFLQHYTSLPWGWAGVNTFFVLSGFLITGILFDTRDNPHRARNFYVRRSLRIFPLYYAVFAAILLTLPVFHWKLTRAWLAWPLYVGNYLPFLSRTAAVVGSPLRLAANAQLHSARFNLATLYLGHLWSLCVEEQFYLFWPWVVFLVSSRRALLWICGATVVLSPLLRLWVQHTAPDWMLKLGLLNGVTLFQLDSLLIGGLIALLWRGQYRQQLVSAGRVVASAASVIAVLYLAHTINLQDPKWKVDYVYPVWRLTWGLSFINVFSAGLILCLLKPNGWLYRLLSTGPLRSLGRISYGAYVIHDIFHRFFLFFLVRGIQMLIHFNAHFAVLQDANWLLPPFAFAGTLVLAWLSFHLLESPFLNLKERWTLRG